MNVPLTWRSTLLTIEKGRDGKEEKERQNRSFFVRCRCAFFVRFYHSALDSMIDILFDQI